MSAQLPLRITLPDNARWENYYAGPNGEAVSALKTSNAAQTLFIWGPEGTGKTHLLQAACHDVSCSGGQSLYIPLCDPAAISTDIFDDLEHCSTVCVDNLETIASDAEWERALFHFFNRCLATGTRMIFAARINLAAQGIELPDLRTRLRSGLVYHLRELNDDDKIAALQFRAAYRGIELPLDAAQYLLKHAPRSAKTLFELLERLDWAALAAQRRITKHFLRDWFTSNAISTELH